MNLRKNRLMAILIAAILTLSTGASVAFMPIAHAHTPSQQLVLFPFINVGPDPIGVGQTATVGFWLNLPPITASGPYGDRYGNITVAVTKPNGAKETLGPFVTDDTGGTVTRYTPDQVGTYSFQMIYGGQTITGSSYNAFSSNVVSFSPYVNDTIAPATSAVVTLTVQQSPVSSLPATPLPTSYWQTPINAMNVLNWWTIGGPYLGLYMSYGAGKGASNYNTTTNFNPYSTAPLAPHIMWTRPVSFGGAIGGDAGGTTTYGNYYSTSQYERRYVPIVINGFLFYTEIPGSSTTPMANVCVDLYTGKTVWVDDGSNFGGGTPGLNMMTDAGTVTNLVSGQVLDYVSPNQYGGLAYLWTSGNPTYFTTNKVATTGTTLNLFDAMTGKYILSVVNGTGFSYGNTVDASGNIVNYYTNTTAGSQTIYNGKNITPNVGPTPTKVTNPAGGQLLEAWNSTQEILIGGGWNFGSASGWQWRPPQGAILPFSYGIQSAWQLPSYAALPGPWAIMGINSGVALMYSSASLSIYFQAGYVVYTAMDLKTGNSLWEKNVTLTPYTALNLDNYGNVGDGVFLIVLKETGQVYALSTATGNQVWQTTLHGYNGGPIQQYDTVGGIKGNIYGDKFLLFGFGGDMWSLNMTNGALNWYTNTTQLSGNAEFNTPYNIWPIWVQTGIGGGGGIEFLEEGHEYAPPLFIGSQLLAVNTTTGKLAWSIDSFDVDANPELAYGIMTTLNAYDNQIYAYGQGPSKTTVSVPGVGVMEGQSVVISGRVTDVSAGASQEVVAANFPNGLPAVSDESMSQFMETVYMQQPMASNITGVPVSLYVMDSNHNYRSIGTTTTNSLGDYSFTWKPDISGDFTVYASFAGSHSYYGSSASAAFYANSAPTPTAPAATPQTGLASNATLEYGIIAIIIVVVIIGAVLVALMLRKKP